MRWPRTAPPIPTWPRCRRHAPGRLEGWLDGELRGSRVEIERRLGHPVGALAWPFGAYNVPLIDAAKAAATASSTPSAAA